MVRKKAEADYYRDNGAYCAVTFPVMKTNVRRLYVITTIIIIVVMLLR